MKIVVRAANRGWTWAFVARNGKQVANNEVFASRSNAVRAAVSVARAIVRAAVPGATVTHKTKEQADGTLYVELRQ